MKGWARIIGTAAAKIRRRCIAGGFCRERRESGSVDNSRAIQRKNLKAALAAGRKQDRTSVIVIETSYDQRVPGYESWWDVPIAEVSERDTVKAARRDYEQARKKERFFF